MVKEADRRFQKEKTLKIAVNLTDWKRQNVLGNLQAGYGTQ